MSITYLESAGILDRAFGSVAWTPASTYYVGLSTTAINADGSGATEPSGGAYARVAVVNSKANFTSASNGSLTNSTSITFTESTASWGTITYIALFDALTGGNVRYYEALTSPRAVGTQTTVYFNASSITFSLTN